jgi:hypothetical protein
VARCMGATARDRVPSCWVGPAPVVIGLGTAAKREECLASGIPRPGSPGPSCTYRWPLVVEAQRVASLCLSGGDWTPLLGLPTMARRADRRPGRVKSAAGWPPRGLRGGTRQSGSSFPSPALRLHCPTLQYHPLGSCCLSLSTLADSPAPRILQDRPVSTHCLMGWSPVFSQSFPAVVLTQSDAHPFSPRVPQHGRLWPHRVLWSWI